MRPYKGKGELGIMEKEESRVALRKKLLDSCIVRQQSLIRDFDARIRQLLQPGATAEATHEKNGPVAPRTELDTLKEALDFSTGEMEMLQNLLITRDWIRDKVSLGAVVTTDSQTFFISCSIGEITVDGRQYTVISTASPVYQDMTDKTRGDRFSSGEKEYIITDIF